MNQHRWTIARKMTLQNLESTYQCTAAITNKKPLWPARVGRVPWKFQHCFLGSTIMAWELASPSLISIGIVFGMLIDLELLHAD